MRQLDLTITELISLLSTKGRGGLPECLITSEIGEIFGAEETSSEDRAKAESALLKLLESEHENSRRTALTYLVITEPSSEEHVKTIKDFIVKNPGDARSVREMVNKREIITWVIW